MELVAVDSSNVPTPVPRAIADYEQEYEVYEDAEARRNRRLQQRRELVQKEMAAHPKEFEKVC